MPADELYRSADLELVGDTKLRNAWRQCHSEPGDGSPHGAAAPALSYNQLQLNIYGESSD